MGVMLHNSLTLITKKKERNLAEALMGNKSLPIENRVGRLSKREQSIGVNPVSAAQFGSFDAFAL